MFICSGTFVGLENIIEQRINQRAMGFGAEIHGKKDRKIGAILAMVQPADLLKYGLIPEFIGRLPVVATLDDLDEQALVKILGEPKNALIKQYEKLFAFERVKLKFTESALATISRKARFQKTGARGLRAILEEVMLDLMYELPSQKEIKECIITEDVINGVGKPVLLYEQDQDIKSA